MEKVTQDVLLINFGRDKIFPSWSDQILQDKCAYLSLVDKITISAFRLSNTGKSGLILESKGMRTIFQKKGTKKKGKIFNMGKNVQNLKI